MVDFLKESENLLVMIRRTLKESSRELNILNMYKHVSVFL